MGFMPPGSPAIQVIQPANPGAGNDITVFIDANQRLEVIGVQYTLNTDATATTRIPNIRLPMGGTNIVFWDATGIMASSALIFSWWAGLGETKTVSSLQRYNPLPPQIILTEQAQITTLVFNLQPADVISNFTLWAKRWIQPD